MNIEQIARICHETNRAYCESTGDHSQRPWDEAEEWQRQSTIEGVQFGLANPTAPASAQHEAWRKEKRANGWHYGPAKDPVRHEHPSLVAYDQLPLEERIKDHLFQAVVRAFTEASAE
jgi:hypothetical protein